MALQFPSHLGTLFSLLHPTPFGIVSWPCYPYILLLVHYHSQLSSNWIMITTHWWLIKHLPCCDACNSIWYQSQVCVQYHYTWCLYHHSHTLDPYPLWILLLLSHLNLLYHTTIMCCAHCSYHTTFLCYLRSLHSLVLPLPLSQSLSSSF